MTDIRPDLTGDVPRCSVECPHSEQRNDTTETTVRFCAKYGRHIEPGYICIPAVRELVQLSRRRWVSYHAHTPTEPGEYHVLAELDDGTIEEQRDTWSELEQWTGWQRGLDGAVIAWEAK